MEDAVTTPLRSGARVVALEVHQGIIDDRVYIPLG
jgi:hypothetical protein